ncbi:MAG: tetratricopeptide repeat protein [Sandaracinus sp.]
MKRLVSIVALAVFLLSAPRAMAQSASEQALARDQFRAGVAAARDGHWAEAVDAFQRSLELAPRPMTMMNLAGALVQVGRLVEAAEAYRMFLAEATSGAAARVRGEAQSQLEALEPQIPHVRLHVYELADRDVVQLDEYQLSPAAIDAPLPVDPGHHVVTVSRDGVVLATRELDIAAAEEATIDMRVDALPPVEDVATAPDPLAPVAPAQSGGSVFDDPVFWIVGGVVLAGLIGGGIAIGVATQPAPAPYFGNLPPHQIPLE